MNIAYKNLNKHLLKRQYKPVLIGFAIYLILSIYLCWDANDWFAITSRILPFVVGMEDIDPFAPFLASATVAYPLYLLKKDGFLKEVSSRIPIKEYLKRYVFIACILVFMGFFITNLITLIFSVNTASLYPDKGITNVIPMYMFGDFQESYPLLFGTLWILFKSVVLLGYALVGIILALRGKNIFVILFTPALFALLESFFTSSLKLESHSFENLYVLNRLNPGYLTMPILVTTTLRALCCLGLFYYFMMVYRRRNQNELFLS